MWLGRRNKYRRKKGETVNNKGLSVEQLCADDVALQAEADRIREASALDKYAKV